MLFSEEQVFFYIELIKLTGAIALEKSKALHIITRSNPFIQKVKLRL